jgi:hypothetical protein
MLTLRFPFADYLDDLRSAARMVPPSKRALIPTFDTLAQALPYNRATLWRATAGQGKHFDLALALDLLRYMRSCGFEMHVRDLLEWGDPTRPRARLPIPSLQAGDSRLRFDIARFLELPHAPTVGELATAAGITRRTVQRFKADVLPTVALPTLSVTLNLLAERGIFPQVEEVFL